MFGRPFAISLFLRRRERKAKNGIATGLIISRHCDDALFISLPCFRTEERWRERERERGERTKNGEKDEEIK